MKGNYLEFAKPHALARLNTARGIRIAAVRTCLAAVLLAAVRAVPRANAGGGQPVGGLEALGVPGVLPHALSAALAGLAAGAGLVVARLSGLMSRDDARVQRLDGSAVESNTCPRWKGGGQKREESKKEQKRAIQNLTIKKEKSIHY